MNVKFYVLDQLPVANVNGKGSFVSITGGGDLLL